MSSNGKDANFLFFLSCLLHPLIISSIFERGYLVSALELKKITELKNSGTLNRFVSAVNDGNCCKYADAALKHLLDEKMISNLKEKGYFDVEVTKVENKEIAFLACISHPLVKDYIDKAGYFLELTFLSHFDMVKNSKLWNKTYDAIDESSFEKLGQAAVLKLEEGLLTETLSKKNLCSVVFYKDEKRNVSNKIKESLFSIEYLSQRVVDVKYSEGLLELFLWPLAAYYRDLSKPQIKDRVKEILKEKGIEVKEIVLTYQYKDSPLDEIEEILVSAGFEVSDAAEPT